MFFISKKALYSIVFLQVILCSPIYVFASDLATIKRLDHNVGELFRTGQYKQALTEMKKILSRAENSLGLSHSVTLDLTDKLGLIYNRLGYFRKAEKYHIIALEGRLSLFGQEHPETVKSLSNLGSLHLRSKRYQLAEKFLQKAYNISNKNQNFPEKDRLRIINDLSAVFVATNRIRAAKPLKEYLYQNAAKVLGPSHPDSLVAINNLAELERELGNFLRAEKLHHEALSARKRIQGNKHRETIVSEINLAYLYHQMGKYYKAIFHYKTAILNSEQGLGANHFIHRLALNNIAWVYFSKRQWSKSLYYWRRSNEIIVRELIWNNKNPILSSKLNLQFIRPDDQFWGMIKAGKRLSIYPKQNKLSLSAEMFRMAQWSKISELSSVITQMAVRATRGNSTLVSIIREKQDLTREWSRLNSLRNQILSNKAKIYNSLNEIKNVISGVERQLKILDFKIKNTFPRYTSLSNPRPINIKQVQSYLKYDEVLILFLDTPKSYSTPEETFIWLVSKGSMKWFRSSLGSSSLGRMVQDLRCGLDRSNWIDPANWPARTGAEKQRKSGQQRKFEACQKLRGLTKVKQNRFLPFDEQVAYELYEGLFGQIKDEIKGKKLLLVPSGALTSLPFQVLITQKPSETQYYHQFRWLIQDHDLTVLPSVSSLKALRQTVNPSKAGTPYFGIGNMLLGVAEKDKEALKHSSCSFRKQRVPADLILLSNTPLAHVQRGGSINLSALRKLHSLPETADELCQVGEALGASSGSILLAGAATEGRLKRLSRRGLLQNAKVIHFATHGFLSGETQDYANTSSEPSLMLSLPDKPSEEDDGLLTASEVAQLKLDADLVILSACNTAGGEEPGAEPLSGLAKAFFYAGARALLVSHWRVNSEATVELITRSIEAMKQSPSIGHAGGLGKAMRDMIRENRYSHPEFWAPFIIVGQG